MMLESSRNLIRRVGKRLGLSDHEINRLIVADAEHQFDIELKNGKSFKAFRVQHSNKLGPYKGGIRFHPAVNLDEVRALATLMSMKTAAIGLPLGGGKGGVTVNAKELGDEELEELSRKYAAHMVPHIGPETDIPAPDVNTDNRVIDWMADEYEKQTGDNSGAAFTGKSITHGGSAGRDAATGRGGVIVLRELLASQNHSGQLTYAIQGFGNVGSFFGKIAEKENPSWKLVAATDTSGGIYNPAGLPPSKLVVYKAERKALADYPEGKVISNEDLIGLDVDVLVLAALGDAVTSHNLDKVKAKYILELANGPVDEVAYNALAKQGVQIVPDIVANAGGVIVSYLEWLQNRAGEHWSEEEVNQKLEDYLVNATKNIVAISTNENLSLKEAAFAAALRRILKRE